MRHSYIDHPTKKQSQHNKICKKCGCEKIYSHGSGRFSHYEIDGKSFYDNAPKCLF